MQQKTEKKIKNDAKNAQSGHFIPNSTHTWHMCSG